MRYAAVIQDDQRKELANLSNHILGAEERISFDLTERLELFSINEEIGWSDACRRRQDIPGINGVSRALPPDYAHKLCKDLVLQGDYS
jgi:hypothetical protein